jgi:predicted phage terminase large subunit-like protein
LNDSNSNLISRVQATPLESIRTAKQRLLLNLSQAEQDQSIEASKSRCQSLAGYIRESWHVVEPGTPLVWGWHIDAVCRHLEAVTYGKITRLLINVPPGTMKSLIVSVFWPSWEWGPAGMPHLRYYTTSFKDELVTRDTRKMRDLVFSDWYAERWGHLVNGVRGGEKNFSNTAQGWRIGSAWTSLTGERGHRLIIDDPHSTEQAESEAERKRAVRIFRESAPSRIVDPQASAIIIVMQRLHSEDISGVAIALGGYVHLMLPMEFEADRCCQTVIGFKDPRTYEGELLFPERFTRETVDRDKAVMGPFAVAGQYQQRPQAREGGMFKTDWLRTTKAHTIPQGIRWVRYWDLAATSDQYGADPAYTVGVKLGRLPDGKFVVGDVARLRAEGPGVRRLMRDTAKQDGQYVEIGFSKDPGQAGKTQAADLVLMLAGYVVHPFQETGDKETRAEPVAAQAAAGNLLLVEDDWNRAFIDELTTFPGSKHKDQVDALSGAFRMLLQASLFSTPEEWFTVDGGNIPATWPRCGALSFTPSHFNAVWMAFEPATGVAYVYEAVSTPRQDMAIHARTLTSRGAWLPFVMDWEDQGRTKLDNEAMAEKLTALGVNLMLMPFSFESAVEDIAAKLPSAEIRVFQNLTPWFAEYRRISRNEKGQIEEAHVGILRSTGLALTQGRNVAITENRARSDQRGLEPDEYSNRNPITGY